MAFLKPGERFGDLCYVHIVETPSAADALVGRSEAGMLSEFLKLANIPYMYSQALDPARFVQALDKRIHEGRAKYQRPPIVHISAHGTSKGLVFPNGEGATWNFLAESLRPVNRNVAGDALVVALSACMGSHFQSAMGDGSAGYPFGYLIACEGTTPWDATAVGFTAFYFRFLCVEPNLWAATQAMNMASGAKFRVITPPESSRVAAQVTESP